MKVRCSSGVIATDTTATDIVFSGAGTCSAAIIALCGAPAAEGARQVDSLGGIGFTDFTVQTCVAFGCEDDQSPQTETFHRHHATLGAIWTLTNSNAITRSASLSAISNGIRLTPQESGAAKSFIVICFFGGTWDCFTLDVTKTTAQTEVRAHGLGTKPNLGFFSTSNNYDDGGGIGFRNFGMMSDEGTLEQVSVSLRQGNNASVGQTSGQIRTDRCAGQVQSNGDLDEGFEITGNDATNTTFQIRNFDWTNKPLIGLLGLIDETTNIEMVDSPDVDDADWNVNDNSFLPQAVIGCVTQFEVVNTSENDDKCDSQAVFCMNEEGEDCSAGWRTNDGASPTEEDNECRSSDVELMAPTGAGVDYRFHSPVFTSDGFDILEANVEVADAVTHIFPMMFIGQSTSVIITDVNTTETWNDGDTGLVITGTGFV